MAFEQPAQLRFVNVHPAQPDSHSHPDTATIFLREIEVRIVNRHFGRGHRELRVS